MTRQIRERAVWMGGVAVSRPLAARVGSMGGSTGFTSGHAVAIDLDAYDATSCRLW